jgi:hypothetical protein
MSSGKLCRDKQEKRQQSIPTWGEFYDFFTEAFQHYFLC